MRRRVFISIVLCFFVITNMIFAQSDFAATLEVLSPSVTVQRVNTANEIEVSVEAIVGVGDVISTGEDGRARITFFADGTSTELEPNTIYRIDEFNGDDESFTLHVSVIVGRTTQQLERLLDSNSSYQIETPGMTMAARGTVFDVRVEDTGRAGMIVREGVVDAGAEDDSADVPAEFGIRSAEGEALSDVVRASTFDELDAALDGCTVQIATPDDVSLNVRSGPSVDTEQVGFIAADEIAIVLGSDETGAWYRIEFDDGFGWVLSSSASIDGSCAGLRVFPNSYQEGDSIEPDVSATPEATEEAGD